MQLGRKVPKFPPVNCTGNVTCTRDEAIYLTTIIGIPTIGGLLLLFMTAALLYTLLSRCRRNRRAERDQNIPL